MDFERDDFENSQGTRSWFDKFETRNKGLASENEGLKGENKGLAASEDFKVACKNKGFESANKDLKATSEDFKTKLAPNFNAQNFETIALPLHHIGIACKSIEAERKIFLQLGFKKEAEFIDEAQGIKGEFILPKSVNFPQYRFELLENLPHHATLEGYLKNNAKMYHIAYESKDIERDLSLLRGITTKEILYRKLRKALVVVDIMPASYFARLCFVMLPNGLLVELVELYK